MSDLKYKNALITDAVLSDLMEHASKIEANDATSWEDLFLALKPGEQLLAHVRRHRKPYGVIIGEEGHLTEFVGTCRNVFGQEETRRSLSFYSIPRP